MPRISIVTLNLNRAADRWLQRRQLMVAQLLDLSPDIIALQEVALPIRQAHWLRNQLNARAGRDLPPYQLVQRRRQSLSEFFVNGDAILCRLPIVSHDMLTLSFGRIAVRTNVELPTGETVDIVNTHLHPHKDMPQTRDEQVMRLMGWLDGRSAVQHRVIAGGFREQPDGAAVERMKGFFGFRSAFELANGHEPQATFPTALNSHDQLVGQCYDYIFVSQRIRAVPLATLCCRDSAEDDPTLLPSDHVGIYAEIEI